MKIDWDEIREREILSLKRYANYRGIDPDEFVRLNFSLMKKQIEATRRFSGDIITGDSLFIDLENPTIQEFIESNRKAAYNYSERLLGLIAKISIENHSIFDIDLNLLREEANSIGITTYSDDWLISFLKNVPIVQLFTWDIEAYVEGFSSFVPHITISRTMQQVMERMLLPIIIELLFPEKDWNTLIANLNSKKIPLNPSINLEQAADYIIDVGKFFLGKTNNIQKETNNFILKSIDSGHNPFAVFMYYGAIDFVYLHEYSHILLGHLRKEHSIIHEIYADTLAVNSLFNENSYFYKQSGKNPILFQLQSYGILILLNFFSVLNGLMGYKTSESHPHPVNRMRYINLIISSLTFHDQELFNSINMANQALDYIFYNVHKKIGYPKNYKKTIDDEFVKFENTEIIIVPHGAKSFSIPFVKEAFNRDGSNNKQPDSSDISRYIGALGAANSMRGEHQKSLELALKALEIYEKVETKDSKEYANCHCNVGKAYVQVSNFDKSLKHFLKALSLYESIYDKNEIELYDIHGHIGATFFQLHDFNNSLYHNLKSLEIGKSLLDNDHSQLLSNYFAVAHCYFALNDIEKYLAYILIYTEIVEKNDNKDYELITNTYFEIGRVYQEKNELENSLSFYLKALYNYENNLVLSKKWLDMVYNNLSCVYRDLGKAKIAEQYIIKSIELRESNTEFDEHELAISYCNATVICYELENYTTAKDFVEKAIKIWKKIMPSDNKFLSKALEIQDEIRNALNHHIG